MIEVALGSIAAALVRKALDRAGEKTVDQGEGVLRRLVELVKGRLSEAGDEQACRALERVEDAPDSLSRVEALAHVLEERVKVDPEFHRELDALVKEAQGDGVDVEDIVQATYGNQSPQFGVVSDSEVNIAYGSKDSATSPRRISD